MNKPEKWAAVLCVGLTMTTAAASAGEPGAAKGWADKAQRGELAQRALPSTGAAKHAPAVSGTVLHALEPGSTARQAAAQSAAGVSPADSEAPLEGLSTNTLGCGARNTDGNIRVNQDCDYRPQNETIIKIDPRDSNHVIGGFNDYRTGEGHAGFSFSIDRGRTWGDGTLPMTNRHNAPPPGHTILGGAGTHHTYEASGDPGLAWDSQGNAFYSTGAFDRSTFASAVFATISPAGANGSFYFSIPSNPISNPNNPSFVVAEDNNRAVLHDKPFIAADSNRASPFRDNLYLTWTVFDFSCTGGSYCKSPIYFSRSTDHATSWSMPKPISGSSPALCSFGDLGGHPQDKFSDCNFDQGADPIVLPDGTIVVVFNNGNTPAGNPNSQQLAVISHDAGNSWSGPVKVGDDVSTGEPVCVDAGTTCIPGADVRTNDLPRIGENRQNGHLYVVWQDYRTGEYDIHLSRSTDGGLTWQESNARVNPDSGRDHYFPAVDVANGDQGDEGSRGDLVAVSYFRTDRVPNENAAHVFVVGDPGVGKGNTDYSLAGGHGAATPYAARQVSPETPPPSFRGFNGDYSGLAVTGREAHPLWSDARNNAPPQFGGPQQDEDIFTDIVVIPGE